MKKHNNELGDKILELRTIKNISQDELAAAVGVSRQIVSKWESGRVQPKADKLPLICKALGVGLEALMPQKDTQEDKVVVNENVEVASDVVHNDEAIENQVEESNLLISNTEDETDDQETTKKKRKLTRKAKIAILVTALLIVLSISIIIAVSIFTDRPYLEGSHTKEDSAAWNFSMENISWIVIGAIIAIAIIFTTLICVNIIRKKHKKI